MRATQAEYWLRWQLRCIGILLMLAVLAVPLPHRWMNVTHRDLLQLETLPDMPIIQYLTRSTSLLYVIHGVIMLFVSFDIARYRPVIVLIASLNSVFAIIMFAVDWSVGMPMWWAIWEGPGILAMAIVMFVLADRSGRGDALTPGDSAT